MFGIQTHADFFANGVVVVAGGPATARSGRRTRQGVQETPRRETPAPPRARSSELASSCATSSGRNSTSTRLPAAKPRMRRRLHASPSSMRMQASAHTSPGGTPWPIKSRHAVGRLVGTDCTGCPTADTALLHHPPPCPAMAKASCWSWVTKIAVALRRLEDVAHFLAQPLAQLPHQVRKRTARPAATEARLRGQRPRQRHPLLLAAGQSMRVGCARPSRPASASMRATCAARASRPAHPGKADIASPRSRVRTNRNPEHHADLALVRRVCRAGVGQRLAINQDAPAAGAIKTGNAALHGGFAAAGAASRPADFAALQDRDNCSTTLWRA